MSGRRIPTLDVRTLLRHLQVNDSDRSVSRSTGLARATVRRYREWAKQHDLLKEPLLPLSSLQSLLEETLPRLAAPQTTSSVEPYRDLVVRLRREGVEMRAVHARLRERGFGGSYSAIYRFVKSLEPSVPDVCVRVETRPGEEAQVDFGEVPRMYDPTTATKRRTWAFVMTLSFSRHQYVEFVFDQKSATWLGLHAHAFAFFGGVPKRLTTDNLKAAVIQAAWDDPLLNRAYAECAEHYGFRIAPCRPRTPQHKGKVESGVHYVARNFLAGRQIADIREANREGRQWCLHEAGQRVHGTVKERPLERFAQIEKQRLQPLPSTPYDPATFKQAKLHRDCHLVFEGSYYSAPFRLVGQTLLVRGGLRDVRIFDDRHQLVATHDCAAHPGDRKTHPDHLPPHKLPGLLQTPETCLQQAQQIGPCTVRVVEALLSDPVLERLPSVGRLVRLQEKYTSKRLEAACRRALCFEDPAYPTIKRILQQGLDSAPLPDALLPAAAPSVPTATYARSAEELFGPTVGGLSWN